MGKEDLLKALDAEFDALLQAVDGLTEDQLSQVWYGEWSAKDILSHCAGWHHEMIGVFDRIVRGERPIPEDADYSTNPHFWNERFAGQLRGKSGAQVVAELKSSKNAFVEAVRKVAEDKFEEGRTAHRVLHIISLDHYPEHAAPIREWREREGI